MSQWQAEAQKEKQEAAREEATEAVSEVQAEVSAEVNEAPVQEQNNGQAEVVNEAPAVVTPAPEQVVEKPVVEEKPEVVTEAPTEAPTQTPTKKIESPTDADGTPFPISDVKTNGGGVVVNPDQTIINMGYICKSRRF